MGCSGPALLHSAHHVVITTAVGTPFCWRLTCCHHVLSSQVSYGLMGVGLKYRKLFVCICKHPVCCMCLTATHIRIWWGCPAEVGFHGDLWTLVPLTVCGGCAQPPHSCITNPSYTHSSHANTILPKPWSSPLRKYTPLSFCSLYIRS